MRPREWCKMVLTTSQNSKHGSQKLCKPNFFNICAKSMKWSIKVARMSVNKLNNLQQIDMREITF
jgi:hypothetical protein